MPYTSRNETFTALSTSGTIRGMGKAGKALKQVLETYKITQNRLAVVMETRRSNVGRWFHEQIDSTSDTIADRTYANTIVLPPVPQAWGK